MTDQHRPFLTTLPGVLTGIAAVITAITGLIALLNIGPDKGEVTPDREPQEQISETPASPSSTPRSKSSITPAAPETGSKPGKCDPSLPAVRRVVAEQLGVNPQDLVVSRPLGAQQSPADDLDFVEIILAVEEECGVTIEDSEVAGLAAGTTIERIAQVVERKASYQ
jgi:acyl carrier protein